MTLAPYVEHNLNAVCHLKLMRVLHPVRARQREGCGAGDVRAQRRRRQRHGPAGSRCLFRPPVVAAVTETPTEWPAATQDRKPVRKTYRTMASANDFSKWVQKSARARIFLLSSGDYCVSHRCYLAEAAAGQKKIWVLAEGLCCKCKSGQGQHQGRGTVSGWF